VAVEAVQPDEGPVIVERDELPDNVEAELALGRQQDLVEELDERIALALVNV
jgi:hypothetical protein